MNSHRSDTPEAVPNSLTVMWAGFGAGRTSGRHNERRHTRPSTATSVPLSAMTAPPRPGTEYKRSALAADANGAVGFVRTVRTGSAGGRCPGGIAPHRPPGAGVRGFAALPGIRWGRSHPAHRGGGNGTQRAPTRFGVFPEGKPLKRAGSCPLSPTCPPLESAGVSQEALAAKAELHRNNVGLLERGKQIPSILVVEKLAAALGTTMSSRRSEVEKTEE